MVLGKEKGQWFCKTYDISAAGNFEADQSIPNLLKHNTLDLGDNQISALLTQLYNYRKKRSHLHRDDKILTGWNGLMVIAYAKAYRIIGKDAYLQKAKAGLQFILTYLSDETVLYVSYRNGKHTTSGFLEDYAFTVWACLEIYESTFDVTYLQTGMKWAKCILDRFADSEGGFFMTPQNSETLPSHPKETYDGTIPSGNSVLAYVLGKLASLTGDDLWLNEAEDQIAFYTSILNKHPESHTFALMALLEQTSPTKELVCLTKEIDLLHLAREFAQILRPALTVMVKTPDNTPILSDLAPFTQSYLIPDDHPYAFYLCQNHNCNLPVYSLEELGSML